MKIQKILEIFDIQKFPTKQYKGKFKTGQRWEGDSLDSESKKVSGAFSAVKPTKDPHTVKKYRINFHSDGTLDAYWQYANFIIKNKLWENPYFPRIYTKQQYVDKDQNQMPIIEMEKLHPLHELNIKEVEYLLNKMFEFSEQDSNTIKRDIENEFIHVRNLIQLFLTIISNMIDEKMPLSNKITSSQEEKRGYIDSRASIKDDQLKEAIKKLIAIRKELNTRTDLHEKNAMYRRSPTGVNIVFTDPFGWLDKPPD